MKEKDQTSKGDGKANPQDETAKEDKTSKSEKDEKKDKKQESKIPETDWESKFKASQTEAIKQKKENEKMQEQWSKVSPVLQVINDNPEIMEQIDAAYQGDKQSKKQSDVIEALIEQKVKEKLSPYQQELDADRRVRVETAFDKFVEKHDDAPEHWDKIQQNLKAMKAAGYSLEEGLENAYFLAKKDEAKKAGKKELAFELYQQQQAAAAGGSGAGSGSEDSDELSEEEQKVAEGLDIASKDYLTSKKP